ncbi:transglycosylase SLT domain-containing protein [Pontibaca methylaminivorans]|uniref:Transglycosylase SLT domain-containing protein n=1 Tax=Pontibaca methylaminivorans TaxID=515897 RepID=A0A1R3WTB0_9RHOB|nr:Transglycosylase SLT domain-containing protein [Pontibaca methylaminivorans]
MPDNPISTARSAQQRRALHGLLMLLLPVALLVLPAAPASAAPAASRPSMVAAVCDKVAHRASRAHGVPLDVMRAITRAETGRMRGGELEPWPWTVNMEGTGHWFETRDAARAFVFARFKAGARSFDVGCFQINYRWHGDAFRSIDEMFDPELNARYAAKFLMELYRELGDWSAAAGAYHSRTPSHARSYTARFARIRSTMGAAGARPRDTDRGGGIEAPGVIVALAGTDPLPFIGGGAPVMGSLVPLGPRAGPAPDTADRPAFLFLN